MRDCESKTAKLESPNVRDLVMKSPKNGHREEGEQDTGVRPRGGGCLQKREGRQDCSQCDCGSKRADKGGRKGHELVMKSSKDGNREGEQDTGVKSRGDGSLRKRERDQD